jgi:hypothetical protein
MAGKARIHTNLLGRLATLFPPKRRDGDADWAALGSDHALASRFLHCKARIANVYLDSDGNVAYDFELVGAERGGEMAVGMYPTMFRLEADPDF